MIPTTATPTTIAPSPTPSVTPTSVKVSHYFFPNRDTNNVYANCDSYHIQAYDYYAIPNAFSDSQCGAICKSNNHQAHHDCSFCVSIGRLLARDWLSPCLNPSVSFTPTAKPSVSFTPTASMAPSYSMKPSALPTFPPTRLPTGVVTFYPPILHSNDPSIHRSIRHPLTASFCRANTAANTQAVGVANFPAFCGAYSCSNTTAFEKSHPDSNQKTHFFAYLQAFDGTNKCNAFESAHKTAN
eukprot:gene31272-38638_t